MDAVSQSIDLETVGASRADQLARIEEAGLIKQGRVFLLSLDAIRNELGSKWPARNELVWDTMYKALVKRMPAPDVFIRIDDATILAAVASVDAYEGQVRCAEVLGSTLAFFLGRNADSDILISRVSGLSENSLSSEPVNLAAPPPPRRKTTRAGARPGGRNGEHWKPPLAGRSAAAPFTSMDKGVVAMRFEIVPVWRLDRGVISAYAIRRRLPARLDSYSDHDRELMDEAMVDLLAPLLEEYRREGGVFALIAPGTFSTASSRRPRLVMLERCSAVMDVMRQAVMMEIDGIGIGVPAGRIREMSSMMKPFFRVLTACVRDAAEAREVTRDYAFKGMAIDAEHLSLARVESMIRSLKRSTPNLIIHSVPRGVDEDHLRALGVSHVSYREVAARTDLAADPTPDGWVRASAGSATEALPAAE